MPGWLIAVLGFSAALGWALYFDAGVHPSTWSISLLVIGLTALIVHLLPLSFPRGPESGRIIRWSFLFLFGLAILQLLPLPLPLIAAVSPQRAELEAAVAAIVPGSRWIPFNADPAAGALEVINGLACLLIFLLARGASAQLSSRPWILAVPLIAGGLIESFLGLRQAANPDGPATAMGTFLNRNHFAGFLEMSLPFAVLAGFSLWQCRRLKGGIRIATGFILIAIGFVLLSAILYT